MIIELDVVGASTELLAGCVLALAKHNEVWWRRERAEGRAVSPNWVAERLRYRAPTPSDRIRLRDSGVLLRSATPTPAGCGELAAAYIGWLWSLNLRADLETQRVAQLVWHSRVWRPTSAGRVLWDPERVVVRAAA